MTLALALCVSVACGLAGAPGEARAAFVVVDAAAGKAADEAITGLERGVQGDARSAFVVVDAAASKAADEAIAGLERGGVRVVRVQAADPELAARAAASPDAVWLAVGARAATALAATGVATKKRAAVSVSMRDAPASIAAVVSEVPFSDQARWIKQGFPGRARVVVLRRPGAVVDDELRAAATAAGLQPQLVDVRAPGEAVPALDEALRRGGAGALVWLVPDATTLTPDTIAPLIQAALRARVPVVGFSPYFLKVGALGAFSVDHGAAALQAYALAASGTTRHAAPAAARLVVDARLAERLGVAVRAGEGVEVRR